MYLFKDDFIIVYCFNLSCSFRKSELCSPYSEAVYCNFYLPKCPHCNVQMSIEVDF